MSVFKILNRWRPLKANGCLGSALALLAFLIHAQALAQFATVQVNEPGEWRPFEVGELVVSPFTGTGPYRYWTEIPNDLQSLELEHFFLVPNPEKSNAEEYGLLNFETLTDGVVWMLALTQSNIDTLPPLGWRLIRQDLVIENGQEPFGENTIIHECALFERDCKAGEQFSIRVDTYHAPIVLRTTANPTLPQPPDPASFAVVQINEPGEWNKFSEREEVGHQTTGNGPPHFWNIIEGDNLEIELEHYFLTFDSMKTDPIQYGLLDFETLSDGIVWMLTTVRFGGGGNSNGNWIPELTTREMLEADGWRIIEGQASSGQAPESDGALSNLQNWLLFERLCEAGEEFSIRTEKYQPPILLRAAQPVIPSGIKLGVSLNLDNHVEVQISEGQTGYYRVSTSTDLRGWSEVITLDVAQLGIKAISAQGPFPRQFFRAQYFGPRLRILSQPRGASVAEGQNVEFSVVAEGPGQITYLWYKDGEPIFEAFTDSLTIDSASIEDVGEYSVKVFTDPSLSLGFSISSDIAVLSIF